MGVLLTESIRTTETPSDSDVRVAEQSSRMLASLASRLGKEPFRFRIKSEGSEGEEEIRIPAAAFQLLQAILTEMAKGNALTMIPINAELSTQRAADLLNVSRPFLIDLLEQGRIPYRMVGTHRRVRFSDLMEYKRRIDLDRQKVLAELAAQAQELNLGY